MTNTIQALERFVRPKTILLTSYRRDGTLVGTPVNIAVNGQHAFVRTWDKAWKFRRSVPTPRVLDGSEALYAAHALARKYILCCKVSSFRLSTG